MPPNRSISRIATCWLYAGTPIRGPTPMRTSSTVHSRHQPQFGKQDDRLLESVGTGLGVLSAMLFAFTLSYDEFSRTLFASGRDLTLPLAIYGTFSIEIHPNIFAFGVLTTLFSFALLAVYAILMTVSLRRAKRLAIQEDA